MYSQRTVNPLVQASLGVQCTQVEPGAIVGGSIGYFVCTYHVQFVGIRATNAGALPLKYPVPEGEAVSKDPQIQEGPEKGVVSPLDLAALAKSHRMRPGGSTPALMSGGQLIRDSPREPPNPVMVPMSPETEARYREYLASVA